jgi:hypothetical protein
MEIMVDGSIYPSAQPMPAEPLGIEFISQMSIYVINDHGQKEKIQVQLMNRNSEKKNSEYARFYNCFERMERICGPWGRVR